MAVHDAAAVTAARQIAKHGRWVKLREKSGAYLPDEDAMANDGKTDTDIQALFTMFHNKEIDGDLVKVGDKRLLIAASGLSVTPAPGMLIVDGETIYKVMRTEMIQPGTTAVLYKVQVRK